MRRECLCLNRDLHFAWTRGAQVRLPLVRLRMLQSRHCYFSIALPNWAIKRGRRATVALPALDSTAHFAVDAKELHFSLKSAKFGHLQSAA